MSLIDLEQGADDDLALLFRLAHLISGAIRYGRPKLAHVVKVDNWFGVRWRCFAGSPGGKDLHPEDRLAIPPFAPKRVLAETTYRRSGDTLRRVATRYLHDHPIVPSAAMPFYLDERTSSGVFVWYSGNTAEQDRCSLMVYDVCKGGEQRAWYAEFQERGGLWSAVSTDGTSTKELEDLETAYGNRLAPLVAEPDDGRAKDDRQLWKEALAATYSPSVARATVLIEQYRARHPDNHSIRLLQARNLTERRLFDKAETQLRSIERIPNMSDKWRSIWLEEWAYLCELRRDEEQLEATYRELATLTPRDTRPWILLGACLARQGRLDEAIDAHRHATQLHGDPDEAFLNLGLVLRATGRYDEAADAFRRALALCPDYPAAAQALDDVEQAMRLRSDD